jgi:tRNA (guanine-N7-)-methyltransferase
MSRSLKYEIPGTDWRRTTLELSEHGPVGLFAPELTPPFGLVLEIGFGRGEFLLDLAAKHPERAFLGVEISFKRVLKMARKVARAGLTNVRLVEARAQVVMHELLPPECLDELWINFSDPWPKDRHAQRRLIRPELVADADRCLRPGGVFHVATDDVAYAEQIDEVMRESMLENLFAPDGWRGEVEGRMETGYESDWRAEGRPLHFFEYRRDPTVPSIAWEDDA